MSGYSPGPWCAVRHPDGSCFLSDSNGQSVVEAVATRYSIYLDASWEASEADLDLLAAAPDLLEALEGLLDALPSATTHPAIQAARAAIAKAKGEQP